MNNKLQSIYLIDWDDTLFPTSWCKRNNIDLYNQYDVERYKIYFIELDNTLEKLLYKLNQYGKIYIVTNASLNWIKQCLNMLPYTFDFIKDKNIKILSARDLYSHKYMNIMEWKKNTFQNVINSIIEYDKCTNIISLGDADYEYYALIDLDNHIRQLDDEHCFLLKNIKFMNEPDFEHIIDQIELLHKCIGEITDNLRFVDIKLIENNMMYR